MADLLHQLLSKVVFAYDFDTLTPGGLLRDFGPHGLHATFPGGAASPTKQLDGSYSFDGGDYLTLSGAVQARFYAAAPAGSYCWLWSGYSVGGSVFSCWDSVNSGSIILLVGGKVRHYHGTGAAMPYVATGASNVNDYPRRAFVETIETTPRAFIESAPDAAAWFGGAYAAPAYDTTVVPRIGSYPSGAALLTGRLWYLAQLSLVPSTPELLTINRVMRDGGKPWCWR